MKRLCSVIPLAALLLLAAPTNSTAWNGNGRAISPADRAADTTVNLAVAEKWNLVSVPLIAADMHKDTLFPTSVSNAFYFDDGYVADNDLVRGKGYWLKFDSAETIPLFGSPVHRDTFDVVAGWNMVGSISAPAGVGSVTTIPGGITLSNFWKYELGYLHTSSIDPGRGYWVKASADGSIVLDAGTAAASRQAPDPFTGLHTLTIEDARGMRQTLRFGEATAKLAGTVTEMPPPPPQGAFDARFADGNWVEFYSGGGEHAFTARVSSAAYPITIRWEIRGSDSREIVLNGSVRMEGTGSAVITAEGPIRISAGGSGVPAVYALHQNYPNPFNPATTISYDLPENAVVKLAVYDLLGREIAVLADGAEAAGAHDALFDATGFTSGIYFYRLQAGGFTAARKLVIMK